MTNRVDSIKGLPLTELSVTAIAVFAGTYEDAEGREHADYEFEPINQADWDKFNAPKEEARRCAMCGHGLKIACAITHKPTGNGYWIGRDCAAKVKELASFGALVKNATVALAQRIACDKREADFLEAHPEAMSIMAWCKLPRAPRIARDMIEKMRRFGNLSDKQIAALERIRQQDEERRAKATATAKAGRQVIRGTVVKVTLEVSEFRDNSEKARVILDLGTGVRLMGNCPEYFVIEEQVLHRGEPWQKVGQHTWLHPFVKVGDVIELKATVTPSEKDNLFGFWKRPADFKFVSVAAPVAPAPAPVPVVDERTKWREIILANPVLVSTNFASDVAKWNALKQAADDAGMPDEEAVRFIAAGMAKNV